MPIYLNHLNSQAAGAVRILSDAWMEDYNRFHPHQALAGLAATFAKKLEMDKV